MANAVPVLRLLLDKGADPNAKTLTGHDAADGRVRTRTSTPMRLLIEKKADVNAKNAAGGLR